MSDEELLTFFNEKFNGNVVEINVANKALRTMGVFND